MAPPGSRPEPFETKRSFKQRRVLAAPHNCPPGMRATAGHRDGGEHRWVAGSSPAMTAVGEVGMAPTAAAGPKTEQSRPVQTSPAHWGLYL